MKTRLRGVLWLGHAFITVGLAGLVAACGARTGLWAEGSTDSTGQGGRAGSEVAVGTAAGGRGPGGDGSPASSGAVAPAPRPLSCFFEPGGRLLAGGNDWHQVYPRLSFTTPDAEQMVVAMRWSEVEAQNDAPELRFAMFDPWQNWSPQPVGPVWLADEQAGASFRLAPAGPDRFARLSARWMDASLRFAFDTPDAGGAKEVVVEPVSDGPQFLVQSSTGYLAGYRVGSQMRVRPIDGAGEPGQPTVVGCAVSRLAADAAVVDDRWMVASTTADSWCEASEPQPANRLRLWSSTDGVQWSSGPVLSSEGASTVMVAEAEQGAWVVWQDGAMGQPTQGVWVDSDGALGGSPRQLTGQDAGQLMAAQTVGDHLLVLTWFASGPSQQGQELILSVFDADASFVGRTSLPVPGLVLGADMVVSSERREGLLAFSETDAARWRVRLIRLSCSR